MSLDKSLEITEEKPAEQAAVGPQAQEPATPEESPSSAGYILRRAFYASLRPTVMRKLGEDPGEYVALMESLLEDLQPTGGVEHEIVLQMIESVWRMRRARRMQEGLAMQRIQVRLEGEQLVASTHAWNAMEAMEPFMRLEEALSRRGSLPTPEEIEAFIKSRAADSSEATREFICLLKSLSEPMEGWQRRARRREARQRLARLMQGPELATWRLVNQSDLVDSAENLAALMAPTDPKARLVQKMEDSSLQHFTRLTSTLMKIRQGALDRKNKIYERSGNVYENKGRVDNLS